MMEDDDLRNLMRGLDPHARDTLRSLLIHDQADRYAIASRLMRYRDQNGQDWADIIDLLTMHPDARRKVLRILGEIEVAEQGYKGRARQATGEGSIRPSFASPVTLGPPLLRLRSGL